ncbi:MAG: hypothetical protein HQL26_01450 [Candidatus Omnitrophica bacterium]|nr:hypothetical protein [Candidatus Omnitrophota bacterium]
MKLWGAVVAILYVFILLFLFAPLSAFLLSSSNSPISAQTILSVYNSAGVSLWYFAAVMLIAESALLSIPVSINENRPINKRSIIPLALASSLMMTLLLTGMLLTLCEVFAPKLSGGTQNGRFFLILCAVLWIFWSIIFFLWSKKNEPMPFIKTLCRLLYRGSILELLIAVPSHIYVRQRNECCAGIGTFIGIAAGISVMLFSFGPGVFFLFKERLEHLTKKSK